MDHHCPGVNNCVGEKKIIGFFCALYYVYRPVFSSLSYPVWISVFFPMSQGSGLKGDICFFPPVTVILLIFLCLEGLLFLTFTSVMFGTQIHSICKDQTKIERLKREKATWEWRLCWEGMKSVLGEQPSILKMNPFAGF
uniref:Palmitoyltransferase n=1 Tax=Monodelphis domestica TaxID=13616 RepID=A0A5F8H3N4_MONDO